MQYLPTIFGDVSTTAVVFSICQLDSPLEKS